MCITHFSGKFQICRPDHKAGTNSIKKMNDNDCSLAGNHTKPERAKSHQNTAGNKEPFFFKTVCKNSSKRITQRTYKTECHTKITDKSIDFLCRYDLFILSKNNTHLIIITVSEERNINHDTCHQCTENHDKPPLHTCYLHCHAPILLLFYIVSILSSSSFGRPETARISFTFSLTEASSSGRLLSYFFISLSISLSILCLK